MDLFRDAIKDVIEAVVKGLASAGADVFRKGKERRIAFAKDRIAPVERFAAEAGAHLNQLAGRLEMAGGEYDLKTQQAAVGAWQAMSSELARLENDAWAATALIDPKLLQFLDAARREAMRLYRVLVLSPIRPLLYPPSALPGTYPPQPTTGGASPLMPPSRAGTPITAILQQVDRARKANERVAARVRRLLT